MSDIFGMRPENRGDTAASATATPTEYNPFDALGVAAAPMEAAQITTAWRRAHMHLNRATATPMFPTIAEINAARDYLREASATATGTRTIAAEWRNEPRTFFAERAFGDANVFTATTATANAGPTPIRAGAGARARRSPTQEAPRNTATATPGSGQKGSREDPVNVDDDDDDERDTNYQPARQEDEDEDEDDATATATPTPTPSSAKKPANRSGGGSARATAAASPNVDLEIVVGEWAKSTATPRNAVIARLDSRGRLNFRVVARSIGRGAVPGPTATATGYADIILVGQYQGMTYAQLRAVLLRLLSRHQELN